MAAAAVLWRRRRWHGATAVSSRVRVPRRQLAAVVCETRSLVLVFVWRECDNII